jgi:putative ATP-binding cassette transporter
LALVLSKRYVLMQSSGLAEEIVSKVRIRIVDKIRKSNLLLFERLGHAHIYSALNGSAFTISSSAGYISSGLSSVFMLLLAAGYVAFLSIPAFLLTILCVGVGVFTYTLSKKSLDAELELSNANERTFFEQLVHLLEGFKEVKLNLRRNDDLYENFIVRTIRDSETLKQKTASQFAAMSTFGQAFLFILLAVIIFILPLYSAADRSNIVQIATVILFIMGPLGELIGAVPVIMRSNAAVENINALEKVLEDSSGSGANEIPSELSEFSEIKLEEAAFVYDDSPGRESFRLGPLSLSIDRGEIVFFVGGNGSGKSTFLKVLTGLYPPNQGRLMIDGKLITESRLAAYRSLFSSVFTDFHLFDRLYGFLETSPARVEALLEEMQLSKVVHLGPDRRFASTSLSSGQKKRLALIVAILEDRSVFVLDEFAADQDPYFRRYFYEVLIHRFKLEGRTVLAATHDYHYFSRADKVWKMEFGQITDITIQCQSESGADLV